MSNSLRPTAASVEQIEHVASGRESMNIVDVALDMDERVDSV